MFWCYHCSFSHIFPVISCGKRVQAPQLTTRDAWREGKMAGVSSCLSSICKKSKFPTGDMIVIKTNKKRTDECINQNTAEHRCWAAVCGVSPKEREGDYRSSTLKRPCMKSAWASALDKEATQGSGKSIAPQRISWPVLVLIAKLLMKCMQT